MPMKNVIFGVVLLVIGIGYAVLSADLPERTIQNVPGPSFFPTIIAGMIIILSLSLLIKGVKQLRRTHKMTLPKIDLPLAFKVRGGLVILSFLLFVVALPYLGFIAAGIPFFAVLMALCSESKLYQLVIGSIVIPLLLFYLFREGFNILLPTGQWM